MAIIMGSLMIGQLAALSPDFGKGRIGAAHLFKLFNRIPVIDSASEKGVKPVSTVNKQTFINFLHILIDLRNSYLMISPKQVPIKCLNCTSNFVFLYSTDHKTVF